MKFKIAIIAILSIGYLSAQELNLVTFDDKLKKEVLVGECNRAGLSLPLFKSYFDDGYSSYAPDEAVIKQIKKLRKDVEIIIVFGTWCHDTKVQLPRFLKITDAAGVSEKSIKLIGIDGTKNAGSVDIEWLEITRVPTFVVFKNGRELGRIVENPTTTLEKDILMILTLGS